MHVATAALARPAVLTAVGRPANPVRLADGGAVRITNGGALLAVSRGTLVVVIVINQQSSLEATELARQSLIGL